MCSHGHAILRAYHYSAIGDGSAVSTMHSSLASTALGGGMGMGPPATRGAHKVGGSMLSVMRTLGGMALNAAKGRADSASDRDTPAFALSQRLLAFVAPAHSPPSLSPASTPLAGGHAELGSAARARWAGACWH